MARVGDIIEMRTAKGFAYAQVTHRKPVYGTLVRVIEGFFGRRPENLGNIIARPHRYVTFVPVDALCRRGLGRVVAHQVIPDEAAKFPIFKTPFLLTADGSRKTWWLWDGVREWPIQELTREQERFPSRGVPSPEEFVHRIEIGWMPEDDR